MNCRRDSWLLRISQKWWHWSREESSVNGLDNFLLPKNPWWRTLWIWLGKQIPVQSLDTYCPNLVLTQLGHLYQLKCCYQNPESYLSGSVTITVSSSSGLRISGLLTGTLLLWACWREHWLGSWKIQGFLSWLHHISIKRPWKSLPTPPRGHLFGRQNRANMDTGPVVKS